MLKANKNYEYYADFDSKWADDEYAENKVEFEGEELNDYAESLNRAEERFYDAVESHFEDFETPFETDNLKILEIYSYGRDVSIIFKLLKDVEEEDVKKEIREVFDYTRWLKFFGYEIEVGLYSGEYYTTCIKETIEESDYISEEDKEEIFKNKVNDIKNNTTLCIMPIDRWISKDTCTEPPCNIEDIDMKYAIFLKSIKDAEESDYNELAKRCGETLNNNVKDDIIQFMRKYHTFIQNKVFIPDIRKYECKEDDDFYDKIDKEYAYLIGWIGVLEGFAVDLEGRYGGIYIILSDIKKIDIEE